MKKFSMVTFIFVLMLVFCLSGCGPTKAEQRKWEESKKDVVYTTEITDFTYNTIDSAEDRTDFYVWYENSLGEETSSLINSEEFIDYAHAFREELLIKVEAEVGIGKNGVVEVLKTITIVEKE